MQFEISKEFPEHLVGNAENLSLTDFVKTQGATLLERVKPFSDYLRYSIATGQALYSREIVGATDTRVTVRNPRNGFARSMLMFGSNNYLGLATHPKVCAAVKEAVDGCGVGMGGPPLLSGMSASHVALERRLARLKGGEAALLFPSGYQANLGWMNGLLREGDILLYDELNHASLYDGIALNRQVKALRFRHNDCAHLEKLLRRFVRSEDGTPRQVFVGVEGVYSMDGDLPPLREIAALCRRFKANLVVDDAHGTGVLGENGAGTATHFGIEADVAISMGTFSKAFSTTGGFIVAKQEVIDYLRFFSRPYMFSAHLPPTTVATVLACLDVLEQEPELQERLHANAAYLKKELEALSFTIESETPILPVRVPESIDIRTLNRRFHEEGIFLNSVEFPAVPKHEQRLRVSVMATHTREDLDRLVATFAALKQEFQF